MNILGDFRKLFHTNNENILNVEQMNIQCPNCGSIQVETYKILDNFENLVQYNQQPQYVQHCYCENCHKKFVK